MSCESFFRNDRGQDVAEYCLLTALVLLIAAGVFFQVSGGMQNLWTTANTSLATGNGAQAAGTGAATASSPAQ
jgi:Flp pilus assembly pilin Flp